MNRIINRRQAIRAVVWSFVLCAVISLWPLRLFQETVTSRSSGVIETESQDVVPDCRVRQMFVAQYDKLKSIDIYFTAGTAGDKFHFILYDAAMNIIMQQDIDTGGMKAIPGYCRVQIRDDVEVGQAYFFQLYGCDAPFRVAYENRNLLDNDYIGPLTYGETEDLEHCITAAYHYQVPLRKGKTLLYGAALLLAGILVTWLSGRYYGRHPERNRLLTVEKTVKTVCNPLIAVGAAAAMAAVWPGKMFGDDAVSVAFYMAGIAIAAVILFYAVNHNRTGLATDRTPGDLLAADGRNYLQSVFIAGAVWACCDYMNAAFELQHTAAFGKMLIFVALAVLATYRGRDLFHPVNFLYLVIAGIAAHRYYMVTLASYENPEEWAVRALKLGVWAAVLAGLTAVGAVRFLIRGRIRGICIWYAVPVAIFFVLMLYNRNGKFWPVYLVCTFVLFYLNMAAWENKAVLLRNICNGVLLHFGLSVGYCLLHRPYMFYRYYRYPFLFHTVTISAVYLSMVVCAALIKFLDAWRRKGRLGAVYKELLLLGISASYLIFTLSRTGYLSILVMAVIMVPAVCFSMRRRLQALLRCVGMAAAAVLCCFPVVFTAQRTVPAVAADPAVFIIEEFPQEILHGRYTDSEYYITVRRFVQVFQIKILGVPEDRTIRTEGSEDSAADTERFPLLDSGQTILLASAVDMAPQGEAGTEEGDADGAAAFANGRLEIFKLYYDNLNKTGHEDTGIMLPDGTLVVHAHNIYLQTAYDFGIGTGIVFILFGVATLVRAAVYFHRHREDRVCAALPLAMLILFAAAGLTEWIFHPCCPIACCLLMTLAPLIVDGQKTV